MKGLKRVRGKVSRALVWPISTVCEAPPPMASLCWTWPLFLADNCFSPVRRLKSPPLLSSLSNTGLSPWPTTGHCHPLSPFLLFSFSSSVSKTTGRDAPRMTNSVYSHLIIYYINCMGFQTIYSSKLVNCLKSYTTCSKK